MAFPRPIKRLLVANRGEIATRIIATARELEIETFSIYTSHDTNHTLNSSHSIQLVSPASYLDISEFIAIAKKYKIDSVHPGYGFLSESAGFAKRMWEEARVIVIGPGHEVLARTGDKLHARRLAEECDVPVLPALKTPTNKIAGLKAFADLVGYPVVIKAVDGGGGRGIRIVTNVESLELNAPLALRESPSGKAFAEKAAVDGFRHVEVQIIGDGRGNVIHLWERECSIQRRFQKVVEFAPSSVPDRELVGDVIEAALRMARKVNYSSLGTFEFLVRSSPREFYFLEVNPRLQVEHTVTEALCVGIDLIQAQLLIAQGQDLSLLSLSRLPINPKVPPPVHSIQLRITAEDVSNDWKLSVGKIRSFRIPSGHGVRVDTHLLSSQPLVVGTDFDSLIAKIIVTATTWEDVVCKAKRVLADTYIEGVKTNLDILHGIVHSQDFAKQNCDTQWLEKNTSTLLEAGKVKLEASMKALALTASPTAETSAVAAASNVLFRKGDAWSIALTPKGPPAKSGAPAPSHLQLTRVLRNEFPASLTAELTYTRPDTKPISYLMTLASTTASFGSISSAAFARRGDPGNENHIIIPLPGTLVELLVDEDDEVKQGDVVAVVRQMKMELEIRSNKSGKVKWVYDGNEGDEVGEGILVVELDGSRDSKL